MEDVIYILIMVAFVLIAALFIFGCDRIIGPDEEALAEQGPAEPEHELRDDRVAA